MTTPQALAQARAQQATADRQAAEHALAEAIVAAGIEIPEWATAAEVATWRCVESRLEHPASAGTPLALAHAAYCRAQRAEAKARSAAHLARMAPVQAPAAPPPRRKKASGKKLTIATYLAEARAA
jgi:hypothetical protein